MLLCGTSRSALVQEINLFICNLIFSSLYKKYGSSKKWIYFCEDTTQLKLAGLLKVLDRFQPEKVKKGLDSLTCSLLH